jgi:tagatose 6-phosphate kinase
VKINITELSATLGRAVTPETMATAMTELQDRFGGWLIVTGGPDGSYACNGADWWHISAPPIRALSPIGSGDAYAAGLASAVIDGLAIPAACRLGSACGAAYALSPLAGHLDPARARELLQEVTVTALGAATRR